MMKNLFLRYYALGGIGLQLSIALASSACNSVPSRSLPPSSLPPTFRSPSSAAITKKLPNPNNVRANRTLRPSGRGDSIVAFATRQSYGYNRNGCDSHAKRMPTIDNRSRSSISSSGPSSRSFHPSTGTRLFMLPDHYEHLSIIAPLTFSPLADYLYDLATFMLGLSFMFVAASVLISKPGDEQLVMAAGGDMTVENAELLTPADYADSRSAKRQVSNTIVTKASEAFDSTDFAHEPHLSPELEDAEAAYEIALLASAAHEMADAAEKENRQSKAAMLEREKELEWIEEHDRDAMAATKAEAFQRCLLAEQLANKSRGNALKREAFQRSLLSERIANDANRNAHVKEAIVKQQQKEEWMGSEVRAASMGGPECLPFAVASAAASSAAAQALAKAEAEEKEEEVVEDINDEAAPAAVASAVVADTAERMILGEDIAFFEHSPEPSAQYEEEEELSIEEVDPTQLLMQDEVLSEADQWRKDYVHEVRTYINQNAIKQTKEKMLQKNGAMNDVLPDVDVNAGSIDTSDATPSEELVTRHSSESKSVVKRVLQRGFMRRLRQRRTLLVVALTVVISRRLFLAYFGNALRLI